MTSGSEGAFLMDMYNTQAYRDLEQVLNTFAVKPTQILLGYSGGVDSELMAACLSCFAKKHPQHQYALVHVNHGLSPHAQDWVQHCFERSALYQIPLHLDDVSLEEHPRLSLEAQARDARYKALKSRLQGRALLLTAHHADDQLESLLLALKRGSGGLGMTGIQSSVQLNHQQWVVRPFLSLSRSEIEEQARVMQLIYVEDESNVDERFDRNFLRHSIVPELKSRWPSLAKTASRSAALMAEDQHMLGLLLDQQLDKMLNSHKALIISIWRQQTESFKAALLRRFLARQGAQMPSKAQLEQMIHQLCHAAEDANLSVQWHTWQLKRYRDAAYVVGVESLQPRCHTPTFSLLSQTVFVCSTQCIQVSRIPNEEGIGIKSEILHNPLHIRFNMPGSFKCHPYGRAQRRTVKKLMQAYGIPPWQRQNVPFLFAGDELISALGLWVETAFAVQNDGWHIDCTL
tara:strand:- start:3490 stop:4866 length:1377 start_codon:yes stop_codon:yes gene_type:complete